MCGRAGFSPHISPMGAVAGGVADEMIILSEPELTVKDKIQQAYIK